MRDLKRILELQVIHIKERFGFVDGTSLVGISPNRFLNKNNSSGHTDTFVNRKLYLNT